MQKIVCWKCRWLVTQYGFLHRKKKNGPCDRCLGEQTTMQQAMEDQIWIRHIPPKPEKTEQKEQTKP